MSPEDRAELRRLLEQATPGVWRVYARRDRYANVVAGGRAPVMRAGIEADADTPTGSRNVGMTHAEADAELIVWLRNKAEEIAAEPHDASCSTCKYGECFGCTFPNELKCVRHAPIAGIGDNGYTRTRWPEVHRGDWCGDYESRLSPNEQREIDKA